jgi:ornithine cyclodeaminase/alanine dehydrogenase-like protein (mu-crystallin family)
MRRRADLKILFLKEDDIKQLVSVPEAIAALDIVFRDQARGRAFTNSRQRLRMPGSTLHIMAGATSGYFGYKAYTSAAGGARFYFFLFRAETTELLAMMEADALGQIRTGAATGLATKLLSNPDASHATLFGAGWQAESQLLAMDAVRELRRVWIVNRKPERREAFIRKMQPLVKTELASAESAEEAVRASQIVTTITSSREPVLKGAWLLPGQHINAAGGNLLLRREFDDEAVLRAGSVVVDSIEQARIEAGEFVGVIETGRRRWEEFLELRDVAAGLRQGRAATGDITLFKSLGLAMEDVALGQHVYERAIERGVGRQLDL